MNNNNDNVNTSNNGYIFEYNGKQYTRAQIEEMQDIIESFPVEIDENNKQELLVIFNKFLGENYTNFRSAIEAMFLFIVTYLGSLFKDE